MNVSSNSAMTADQFINRFEADRFSLKKFSRWIDENGKSRILLGFYHGGDPDYPADPRIHRIGVDLLIVDEERAEYFKIGDFINLIKSGRLRLWKGKSKEPPAETADDIQFKNQL